MVTVVVEQRFESGPFDRERFDAAERRSAVCLDLHGVRHLASYVSPDGRRMISLFEAPDAEAVRRTARQLGLGLGLDGVWPATVVREPCAAS